MMDETIGVDYALVDAICNEPRTMVFAWPGLGTRMSLIYWALQPNDNPLVIIPKALHSSVRHELGTSRWLVNGERKRLRIVTQQWLLGHSNPTLSQRTVFEMQNMGVTGVNFIRQAYDENRQIVVRPLHQNMGGLDLARRYGFRILRYSLQANVRNELTPTIEVLR